MRIVQMSSNNEFRLLGSALDEHEVCTAHVKTHKLFQTCNRLVAMLLQQLVDGMCSLVDKLSTAY